ncbi:hypothetical protein WMY93_030761 [Mugilogobius chulae]|uniref:Rhodanese domain-containing protein n=1 Tax=Mugilogobius chulae TaxID=88201 RepID=A0AAW0MFF0_9GOBI
MKASRRRRRRDPACPPPVMTLRCYAAVSVNSVVLIMFLTVAFSRGLCQAFTEVNRRSYSTLSPFFRTFTTTPTPTGCGDADVVTVNQLKSMLASKNVQLFDVRRPDEYEAGHIPTAVNVPLDDLEVSLKLSSEAFQQKFQVKAPAKEDANIVFNCRSGVRSGTALETARGLGFTKQDIFRVATLSGKHNRKNPPPARETHDALPVRARFPRHKEKVRRRGSITDGAVSIPHSLQSARNGTVRSA